jgi:hypothetical protein
MIIPKSEIISGSVLQLQTGFGTDGIWLDIDDHLALANFKNGKCTVKRLGHLNDFELGAPYTIGKPNASGHIPLIMVRGLISIDMKNGKEKFSRVGDLNTWVDEEFNWVYFSPHNLEAIIAVLGVEAVQADPDKEALETLISTMDYRSGFLSENRIFVRKVIVSKNIPLKNTERWLAWDLDFKEVPHPLATELTRLRDTLPAIEKLSIALSAKVAVIKHESITGGNTNAFFLAWSDAKSRLQPLQINGFGIPSPNFIEMAPDGKHFFAVYNWPGAMFHDVFLGRVIPTDSLPIAEVVLLHRFEEYGSVTAAWFGDSKAIGVMNNQGDHPALYAWEMNEALFTQPRLPYRPPSL